MNLIKLLLNKYFIETVIFVLILVLYIITKKHEKKNYQTIILLCTAFFALIGIETLAERPKMETVQCDTTELAIIMAGGERTEFKYTKRDKIPPTINLNGNENILMYQNTKYIEQGATAIDDRDGDLTEKIVTEGNVNIEEVGTYQITYTVSDKKGNETIKVRNVEVKNFEDVEEEEDIKVQGVIYLTFDDGPSLDITPQILDILKEKNVKATFFVLNYDENREELIKREYAEGHTVAIHGYSHVYSNIYQSDEACMNNITELQNKIKDTIGIAPSIMRFPGGSSNTISKNYSKGIMTRMTQKVVECGFRYFDWNVSAEDAVGAETSEEVYNNVIQGLSKRKTNVVLMHDFGGNVKTLNALADIIDYGKNNGYIFLRITEDTPMITHGISN